MKDLEIAWSLYSTQTRQIEALEHQASVAEELGLHDMAKGYGDSAVRIGVEREGMGETIETLTIARDLYDQGNKTADVLQRVTRMIEE